MSDYSIAQAKSRFAQLVQEAQAGYAVRITRRGRPVAVLLSEAEFGRLAPRRDSFLVFTQSLRSQAVAEGLALFDESELAGLRDQSERPYPGLT